MRWLLGSILALVALPALAQQPVLPRDIRGNPIDALSIGAVQKLFISNGGTIALAVSTGTEIIQIVCTVACHIGQGVSPAGVTTSSMLLPANIVIRLRTNTLDSINIASDGTDGFAYVTEMR